MFHAMASSVNKPLLVLPWDLARSQSNLRVATTASPVSVGNHDKNEPSRECFKKIRGICVKGYSSYF